MKERLLKVVVSLVLVAVLVAAVVCPITSQAAAKKTTYNVVLQKGSLGMNLNSINDGAAASQGTNYEGWSFKMVVEEKAKTEKMKSTGGTATYYPVTILAKSMKPLCNEIKMPGGTTSVTCSTVKKDAKGKLYLSGGDVDVSNVMNEKKVTTKIGDGKADPEYSLVFTLDSVVQGVIKETGKKFLTIPQSIAYTTGTSTIVVKGAKGGIEGKVMPDNDTTKTLPKPLVGVPLDLEAGTGTVVGTAGATNIMSKVVGSIDYVGGVVWVMKITK